MSNRWKEAEKELSTTLNGQVEIKDQGLILQIIWHIEGETYIERISKMMIEDLYTKTTWPILDRIAQELRIKRHKATRPTRFINHRSNRHTASVKIDFICGQHEAEHYNDYDIGWLTENTGAKPRLCLYKYEHDDQGENLTLEVWEMQEAKETVKEFLERCNVTNVMAFFL